MNNSDYDAGHAPTRLLPGKSLLSLTIALVFAFVVGSTGCSRLVSNQPDGADKSTTSGGDSADVVTGDSAKTIRSNPPEQAVSDFADLGFRLDTAPFNVVAHSATRTIWPNGYRLESATWRGESGFPRIMINVLDVSQSGESFSRASPLFKPSVDRIRDLLPGEEIAVHDAGQLNNEYGRTDFQMFSIDSRISCAFVSQFLTTGAITGSEQSIGEIVVEAIVCDQNTAQINRPYLEQFTNAFRIGKSSL